MILHVLEATKRTKIDISRKYETVPRFMQIGAQSGANLKIFGTSRIEPRFQKIGA